MNCPECAPKAEEKRLEELRKALKSDADVKAGVVEHPDYFVAKSEGEKREWKKEQEGKNWYGNYEAKSERETREWKKNEEKNWFGNYEAKGDRETREWKKKKEEENWFDK